MALKRYCLHIVERMFFDDFDWLLLVLVTHFVISLGRSNDVDLSIDVMTGMVNSDYPF